MEALCKHLFEGDGAIELAKYLKGTGFRIEGKTRAIEFARLLAAGIHGLEKTIHLTMAFHHWMDIDVRARRMLERR